MSLLRYDFKFSLFVLTPIYLIGFYFLQTAIYSIEEALWPGFFSESEIETRITSAIWGQATVAVFLVISTYMAQKKTCELTIERIQIKEQQEQLNDLIHSLKDGILVASRSPNVLTPKSKH